jgi:uncharacterized protein
MKFKFLGFDFELFELSQKDVLAGFLTKNPQPLSGFTVATFAAWHEHFEYGWIMAEPGTLLISWGIGSDGKRHLMQPLGQFSLELQRHLLAEAENLPYDMRIVGVSDAFLNKHPDFVGRFEVKNDRGAANYVYRTADLAKLPGRKYSKKRNLIAQASGLYQWTVVPLTPEHTDKCFSVLEQIRITEQPEVDQNMRRELAALEYTLHHFQELEPKGIVIMIGTQPVAFSIYEVISADTVAIHFERALRSYKGLYQVVNREAARVIEKMGIEFINREEDIGDSGLREAKLSYYPQQLVSAYELIFKVCL